MFPFFIPADVLHGASLAFGALTVYHFYNVIVSWLKGAFNWIKNHLPF